ncbi:MAG: OmpH family outer membrane protein [Lentisphaerae bacterium]|nr:OmpH family outer membrane protein [Lentisphaerota bacterium]
MRALRAWGLGLLMASAMALNARAAADRIAVVKLEQLLRAHPDTTPAETILEKQRQEFESERKSMMEEREKRKKAFEDARDEADNAALSEEARATKVKAAQEKYVDLRDYERDLQDLQGQRQKELNDHGRRLRERIVEKIRTVIKTYADDEGYTVVLNAEDAGISAFGTVLYHADKTDITDDILKIIVKPANP